MGYVLGVDIGSTATKIVVLNAQRQPVVMDRMSASDPKASLFAAVGSVLYDLGIAVSEVEALMMTGMGASYIKGDVLGIPVRKVTEFDALGAGGLYLSGKTEAIVTSIGTGTTVVYAGPEGRVHMGGSAVGGGTLTGLCSRLFGIRETDIISEMADRGDLKNVDWGIAELSCEDMPSLPDYATSSNLGKMKSTATDDDVALGLLNMIYQTSGTMAVFACRNKGLREVVMVGGLCCLHHAGIMLGRVGELYGIDFMIPDHAAYATALGAAMLYYE